MVELSRPSQGRSDATRDELGKPPNRTWRLLQHREVSSPFWNCLALREKCQGNRELLWARTAADVPIPRHRCDRCRETSARQPLDRR
jgi:hypothetical protein